MRAESFRNQRRVVFSLLYRTLEDGFGFADGGTAFGHKLMWPAVVLRRRLESQGWAVDTTMTCSRASADVVVYWDLSESMLAEANGLDSRHGRVLICMESPVYAPLSHRRCVVASRTWDSVLTFNRSLSSPGVRYFDMPYAGAATLPVGERLEQGRLPRGVIVASYRGETCGVVPYRDRLFRALAGAGEVDVYGAGWPSGSGQRAYRGQTPDKIDTLRGYRYAVVVENAVCPGYVTEKLADAVLSSTPALYYGDSDTADRRFPGCHIRLKDLSIACFREALTELSGRYAEVSAAQERCRLGSDDWCVDFVDAVSRAIEDSYRLRLSRTGSAVQIRR